MPNQTKAFNKLKQKWYAKLKKSGFEDIEQDENYLKTWSVHDMNERLHAHVPSSKKILIEGEYSLFKKEHALTTFNNTYDYYRLAGQFVHDYEFPNSTDKLIWTLHSEGISYRNISLKLKEGSIKKDKTQILNTIKVLKKEMLKLYAIRSD